MRNQNIIQDYQKQVMTGSKEINLYSKITIYKSKQNDSGRCKVKNKEHASNN